MGGQFTWSAIFTGYLLRWGYFDQARRCLQQALVTRPDLVSIYDGLARAYLGLEQPDRALEIMRRREAYASPLGVADCAPIQAKGVLLITGSLPLGESCPDELAFTSS